MKSGYFAAIILLAARLGVGEAAAEDLLPQWLRMGGEERVRVESLDGIGFQDSRNSYALQRLRINLEAAPVSWLKFSLQAQDARVFFGNVSPAPASQQDAVDLRLAYVQIGNTEANPVSFRVGRQSLAFGEGRLIADPGWSNVGRTFDGARAIFRYGKWRLDAFTGVFDKVYTNDFDRPVDGEHFHGLYGSMERVVPGASVEPYLLWRLESDMNQKTAGVRWVGKLRAGFDYGWELAIERGRQAGESISAWAVHTVAGRTFGKGRHQLRAYLEWNRASGDRNVRDGVHGAFDPLFPGSHDKVGLADQFCWTNIVHARAGGSYQLRQGLRLGTAYNSFWLADSHDGIYSGGKVTIASDGKHGRHIGQEADVSAQWSAGRKTVLDAGIGYVIPGQFLIGTGRRSGFRSGYLGVTQSF